MRACVLLAILAGMLLAADAPTDDAVKKELKQLEGTWALKSQVRDGTKAQAELLEKVRIIYSADGKFSVHAGEKVLQRGTVKVDPAKKPKTFDVVITEGEVKGKSLKGQTIYGIYEIDGDTRRLCYVVGKAEDRPTEFASKPGSGAYLDVHKRVKE